MRRVPLMLLSMAESSLALKSILAAQFIMISQLFVISVSSWTEKPRLSFNRSPCLSLIGEVHWLHLRMDELVEFALVDRPQPIETGTADHLLLEALRKAGALFGADQGVYLVDRGKGEQDFLKEDFPEEACGASDK